MKKGKKLYEGKAKIIYASPEKNLVIQHFKDDATAFNNQKKATIEGKGILNNRISEHILTNLNQVGIKNHLVKRINMREQLVTQVEIIPIEFIVRNIASGSLSKRLGIEEGTILENPLIEYCLKNDELQDPIVSKDHIFNFDWASKDEIKEIDKMTKDLPVLKSFVLNGGDILSSHVQISRTICRRAERKLTFVKEKYNIKPIWIVYLNRLSDFLFVLGRFFLKKNGKPEFYWKGS